MMGEELGLQDRLFYEFCLEPGAEAVLGPVFGPQQNDPSAPDEERA